MFRYHTVILLLQSGMLFLNISIDGLESGTNYGMVKSLIYFVRIKRTNIKLFTQLR